MGRGLKMAAAALAVCIVVAAVFFIGINWEKKDPGKPQSTGPAATNAESKAFIANYTAVVGMLITYSFAQGLFYNADFGDIPGNNKTAAGKTYCDNFRNLHYGYGDSEEGEEALDFLPVEVADAFAGPARGNATQRDAPKTPEPYSGYFFLDDPAVRDWSEECGLVAYPARYGETGRYVFWIGGDLPVLKYDPELAAGAAPVPLAPKDSPLHPEGAKKWSSVAGLPETW